MAAPQTINQILIAVLWSVLIVFLVTFGSAIRWIEAFLFILIVGGITYSLSQGFLNTFISKRNTFFTYFLLSGIWLFAALTALVFVASYEDTFAASLPLIMAILATAVFAFDHFEITPRNTEKRREQPPPEKRKHQQQSDDADKMRLLLELMDEDERFAFKETLKERMYSRFGEFNDGEFDFDLYDNLDEPKIRRQSR